MTSSKKDYRKLYQLQDKFLDWWSALNLPFYLTGGTALGRFYLNHRFSEDLDFFLNADKQFQMYLDKFRTEALLTFHIDNSQSLFTEDYARFIIRDGEDFLKIEFVNEVAFRAGTPVRMQFGLLDTPLNILSNKLTALISRNEPKDIFDIVYISLNYAFNWKDIFYDAKEKAMINEIDIEQRINTFPVEMLMNIDWLGSDLNLNFFALARNQIADDFLLGRDNSLGYGKTGIADAIPYASFT